MVMLTNLKDFSKDPELDEALISEFDGILGHRIINTLA
jgi:hypothetical protein